MIFDDKTPKKIDAVNANQSFFSTRRIKSIVPQWSKDYEGSVCWHGCDKVSRIGKEALGGGGGS